jgi:hypothetical protein
MFTVGIRVGLGDSGCGPVPSATVSCEVCEIQDGLLGESRLFAD